MRSLWHSFVLQFKNLNDGEYFLGVHVLVCVLRRMPRVLGARKREEGCDGEGWYVTLAIYARVEREKGRKTVMGKSIWEGREGLGGQRRVDRG